MIKNSLFSDVFTWLVLVFVFSSAYKELCASSYELQEINKKMWVLFSFSCFFALILVLVVLLKWL